MNKCEFDSGIQGINKLREINQFRKSLCPCIGRIYLSISQPKVGFNSP